MDDEVHDAVAAGSFEFIAQQEEDGAINETIALLNAETGSGTTRPGSYFNLQTTPATPSGGVGAGGLFLSSSGSGGAVAPVGGIGPLDERSIAILAAVEYAKEAEVAYRYLV